jgi:peroxiredoxin
MTHHTLEAGQCLPAIALPLTIGGTIKLDEHDRWRLIIVYRGKHCPICKTYLGGLNAMLDDFGAAGVDVVAVSGDPKEKAVVEAEEEGWTFPVAYDLSVEQMRELGLYISQPRSDHETDRPFPEPALFVINPTGQLQIIDVSNAPFARPDLVMVLKGLKFIIEKDYPIRGTHR